METVDLLQCCTKVLARLTSKGAVTPYFHTFCWQIMHFDWLIDLLSKWYHNIPWVKSMIQLKYQWGTTVNKFDNQFLSSPVKLLKWSYCSLALSPRIEIYWWFRALTFLMMSAADLWWISPLFCRDNRRTSSHFQDDGVVFDSKHSWKYCRSSRTSLSVHLLCARFPLLPGHLGLRVTCGWPAAPSTCSESGSDAVCCVAAASALTAVGGCLWVCSGKRISEVKYQWNYLVDSFRWLALFILITQNNY